MVVDLYTEWWIRGLVDFQLMFLNSYLLFMSLFPNESPLSIAHSFL